MSNFLSETEELRARIQEQDEVIQHLNDLIFELSENLKCAEDQNHYFVLACEYRDKLYELQKQLDKK